MNVNVYLESTIQSPRESAGAIGYVIEVETARGPATLTGFGRIIATRNQAQIMALNMALARVKKMPLAFSIYADFEQLEAAFKQGWIDGWQKNGWKTAKGEVVKNAPLWQETLILLNGNAISIQTGQQHKYKAWMKSEISRMEE